MNKKEYIYDVNRQVYEYAYLKNKQWNNTSELEWNLNMNYCRMKFRTTHTIANSGVSLYLKNWGEEFLW